MQITRSSIDTQKGTAEWFTGDVHIDALGAPNRFMVHVAMQQNDETGNPVTWGEHVSDEQYDAAPRD